MSRPFSLLLIALGVAILGSLVYLHFYLVDQARKVVATYSHSVNLRLESQQRSDLETELMAYREMFQDDSKARFFPLLNISVAVKKAVKEFEKAIDDLYSGPPLLKKSSAQIMDNNMALQKVAGEHLEQVANTAREVFNKYHLDFDLRGSDVVPKLASFDEIITEARLLPLSTHKLSRQEGELHRQLLTLSFYNTLQILLREAQAIGCYRNFTLDEFYPVLINPVNNVKLGEVQDFTIAIGSYSTNIDPDKTDIRVNGQRLKINNRGLAVISIKSNKVGENVLSMSSEIIHPTSGDTSRSNSLFRYLVE